MADDRLHTIAPFEQPLFFVTNAALLACVAALVDTKLPSNLVWNIGKIWINPDSKEEAKKLKLDVLPVPMSLALWEKTPNELKWFVDPSSEEEETCGSIATIVVDAKEPLNLLSVEYAGSTAIRAVDLALAGRLASVRAQELRSVML